MEPRFLVLTLGVNNLERAHKFYHDGLGLPSKGIIGKEFQHGEVGFFEMKNGTILALYSRENLAWDANVPLGHHSSTEFSIGYNVKDIAEVDAIMELARRAGAKIVKPAQKAFWGGYHGYFEDPDGHLWEILWNPQFLPKD
jgi:catechol 2,3-dioxygenase-like lactoylglutathione lyase family enzyme